MKNKQIKRPLAINLAIVLLLIVAITTSLYLINTYFFIVLLRDLTTKYSLGSITEMGVKSFLLEGTMASILFWVAGLGLYFKKGFSEIATYCTILPLLYYVLTFGIAFYPIPLPSDPLFFVRLITNLYILSILIFFLLPSVLVFKNRKFLNS